jgi:cell division protein FtsB
LKRLVWVPILVVLAAGWTIADERSGLPARQRLKGDLGSAQARIAVLRSDIDVLQREADALDGDAFAIERAIREDLGLALPGETVVRLAAGRPAAAAPR